MRFIIAESLLRFGYNSIARKAVRMPGMGPTASLSEPNLYRYNSFEKDP
jgi:hypothetical protein